MLNLHDIVRPVIGANYPDQELTYYRSLGQTVNDEGVAVSSYAAGVPIMGNFQSEGDAALNYAGLVAENSIIRKLYVYASEDRTERPWGLYRLDVRNGDYIQDKRGDYWLVMAVLEDFSDVGWECLRVQLQQMPPILNIAED